MGASGTLLIVSTLLAQGYEVDALQIAMASWPIAIVSMGSRHCNEFLCGPPHGCQICKEISSRKIEAEICEVTYLYGY